MKTSVTLFISVVVVVVVENCRQQCEGSQHT